MAYAPEPASFEWYNELPPIDPTAHVCEAAGDVEYEEVHVPVPAGLSELRRSLNAPADAALWPRLGGRRNMHVVQDAHAACHRLTVLEQHGHVGRLLDAQRVELQASVDDAFREKHQAIEGSVVRALAVTVLAYEPQGARAQTALLDATAYLADTPDSKGLIAAKDTRVAFLAGQSAIAYTRTVAAQSRCSATGTRLRHGAPASDLIEVCVSWAERADASDEFDWQIRSEFARVGSSAGNGIAFVRAIVGAVREIGDKADHAPCTRLLSSYGAMNQDAIASEAEDQSEGADVEGAYERSVVRTALAFFALLRPQPAEARLDDVTEAFVQTEGGFLDFTGMWARIVPRDSRDAHGAFNPSDPRSFFAALVHREEPSGAAFGPVDMLKRFKAEEREKGNPIFGLRRPTAADEHSVGLHALVVAQELKDIGYALSNYGLLGTPGLPLRWGQRHTLFRCLERKLVPIDDELLADHFVLPVGGPTLAPSDPTLSKAIYYPFNDAFLSYCVTHGHWFRPVKKPHRKRRACGDDAPASPRCRTPTPTAPSSREELAAWTSEGNAIRALGLPFGCPARRLNDVQASLARLESPQLSSMVGLMIRCEGENASLLQGVQAAREALARLAEAKEAAETAEPAPAAAPAPAPAAASAPAPAPAPVPPASSGGPASLPVVSQTYALQPSGLQALFQGLGIVQDGQVTFHLPSSANDAHIVELGQRVKAPFHKALSPSPGPSSSAAGPLRASDEPTRSTLYAAKALPSTTDRMLHALCATRRSLADAHEARECFVIVARDNDSAIYQISSAGVLKASDIARLLALGATAAIVLWTQWDRTAWFFRRAARAGAA